MTVPYTFGTATTSIPLSNLDSNFNTPITLGNTAIYLGNTTTTIGNLTLTNATISSGTVNITNVTVTTANVTNITVTGTANIATGNITTLTSTSITDSGLTSGRVTYAGASGLLSDSANLTFDGTNLTTGGSETAARFIPSGSTVPTNGLYLPAANTIGVATNSTNVATFNSVGILGIGVTPSAWGTGFKALEVGYVGSGINATGFAQTNVVGNAYGNAGWKYAGTGVASLYQQNGSGAHAWSYAASGTIGNAITWIEAMGINSNGGIKVLNTLGVGATTPSTSGSGITFPATQSASSDANTLDDYEEGTWTPAGGSLTNNATATYTKVGRIVYANFDISFPGGGAVAQAQVSGMPFTALSPGGGGCLGICGYAVPILLNIERANTFFVFSTFGSVSINYSDLNGIRLIGTLVYTV